MNSRMLIVCKFCGNPVSNSAVTIHKIATTQTRVYGAIILLQLLTKVFSITNVHTKETPCSREPLLTITQGYVGQNTIKLEWARVLLK